MTAATDVDATLFSIVPRSILVFRALQVGDMLCAVPALRALRRGFPQAHIVLAGLPWASQFARRFDTYIDEFIAFPGHPQLPELSASLDSVENFFSSVSSLQADLALQLHGSGEISNAIVARFGAKRLAGFAPSGLCQSAKAHLLPYPENGHELRRWLTLVQSLGAKPQGESLEFPLSRKDHEELDASGLGETCSAGNYLCLHAGARDPGKCWPSACFAAVGDQLSREFDLQIVLTGSASEQALVAAVVERMQRPAVNAACGLSLGAMAALMQGARLLVCNDTAVSHIAAALRLPSVVIFLNSDMQRWAPLDRWRHRCVQDDRGVRVHEVLAHARSLLVSAAGSASIQRPDC